MGACLGTESGQRYQVDTAPQHNINMGQKASVEQQGLKPPLDVAIIPVTPTTPVKPRTKPKPPSSLAITPATPGSPKQQTILNNSTSTGSPGADDMGPKLFHFAFNTLKGESATDTLVVTPDLLKKPTDFIANEKRSNDEERQESNVSRISSVSQQTCDTISNRSDLSRTGSGASSHQMGAVHELTMRTASAPSEPSNRASSAPSGPSNSTSSTRSSSDMRTLFAGKLRDSMTGEVVMRKDYMKSLLTVRQNSTEPTPTQDVLQWKRGNCLGRGSFGTVYLGLTDTGELIAVKQMEVSTVGKRELEAEYSKIYREVEILKHLKHKNIVQYLGSSFEKSTISIFTQFVSGGSLQNLIHQFGPLGEGIASKYTKQLLSAIAYLHENKVVHRDIKSGNIMMTPEGVMKLIDFGCARKLAIRVSMSGGSHMMRSWKGTPYWMAPEVIHESGHGKKSDIWSLGCTVFEMLTGIPPWGDREPIAAIYAIGCEDVPMPQLDESFSQHAREFVDKCLIKDKFKRPCASALQLHSFIYPVTERQISDTCNEDSKWVETL